MGVFDRMAEGGHEQVFFCRDKTGKLKAIIAIHDTTLGPVLGGTRMYPYAGEDEALEDALRLSQGMTMKSAACGNNYGGGKGVIWGDPGKDKDEILLRAYGRFIQGLGGRFITGTDVGTVPSDFVRCLAETKFVAGLPKEYGGCGDTSILTAYGVFLGIKACLTEVFGSGEVKGRSFAIQGAGKVGRKLAEHLQKEGAELIVADVRREAAEQAASDLGARIVDPSEILFVEADVLSPNAMGGVLNKNTIPRIKAKIVAGGANNQLETPEDARRLKERGILYAPDYVINAGGVIAVADELEGYNHERARRKTEAIPGLLSTIFRIAREEGIDTYEASSRMVNRRLCAIRNLQSIYKGVNR